MFLCRWAAQTSWRSLGRTFSTEAMADAFFCTVCGISGTSEVTLQQHFRGRKHLRGLQKLRSSEKSIYVRGFPSDTTNKTLQTFLEENVGGVSSLWLSNDVKYALVEFQKVEDALKALHAPNMTLLGKKLVIKPRIVEKKPRLRSASPKEEGGRESGGVGLEALGIDEQEILRIAQLDGQVARLCELNSMPLSVVEQQLRATLQLLRELRQSFPDCILVPFGSIITGLASRTSDSDLCLVLTPPPLLVGVLTGDRYFSPTLLSVLHQLEHELGVSMVPPKTPPPAPSSKGEASFGMFDTSSVLTRQERGATFTPLLRKLSGILKRVEGCGKIVAIPHARCPIVRFVHAPTSLHVDICINNILGALNTRLVKAYCEFDERVPAVVSFVKLWSRSQGFPSKVLNSYALGLMVFFFLQHCTPPLLPCLQNPHLWPRDPQWYSSGRSRPEPPISPELTAPWKVNFTPPGSLLRSTNTDSTGLLLMKFFRFYGEEFDSLRHVVSVRTPRAQALSRVGAVRQVREVGREPKSFRAPLVVQDPFDLAHNVTKLVDRNLFRSLRQAFTEAHKLLQKELTAAKPQPSPSSLLPPSSQPSLPSKPSILPLLKRLGKLPHAKTSLLPVLLEFDLQGIASLLLQGGLQQGAAQQLLRLEVNDSVIGQVEQVVLAQLAHLLTTKYGFTVEGLEEEGEGEEEVLGSPGEAVGGGSGDEGEEEVEREVVEEGAEEPMEEEGGEGVTMEVEFGEERKRKRAPTELEEEEEDELCECEPVVQSKRWKSQGEGSSTCIREELETLLPAWMMQQSLEGSRGYVCTAYHNTWQHTRRARRQSTQQPSAADTSQAPLFPPPLSPEAAEMPPLPVLQLRMTLKAPPPWSSSKNRVCCVVKVELVQGENKDYYNLLAILKKSLWSGGPTPDI